MFYYDNPPCFVLLARENDHLGGFRATIFADLSINPERGDLTQGGVRGGGAPPVALGGVRGGEAPPVAQKRSGKNVLKKVLLFIGNFALSLGNSRLLPRTP